VAQHCRFAGSFKGAQEQNENNVHLENLVAKASLDFFLLVVMSNGLVRTSSWVKTGDCFGWKNDAAYFTKL